MPIIGYFYGARDRTPNTEARTSPLDFLRDNTGDSPWSVFLFQSTVPTNRERFSEALAAMKSAYPDFADDAWHIGSPEMTARNIGYVPGAQYMSAPNVPVVRPATRPGARPDATVVVQPLLTEDRTDVQRFDCMHCAYKLAQAVVLDAGSLQNRYLEPVSGIAVVNLLTATTDVSIYLPPGPEVIGDDVPQNGSSTTKNVTLDEIGRACGTCGRLGHNSRTCEAPPKAHDKIGIEIEGRWLDYEAARRVQHRLGAGGCSDGSVRHSDHSNAAPYEFQTVPGSLATALNQLVELYPDEADQSCGMHIHVSFNSPLDVTLLCTPAFFTYFRNRWEAWGTRMSVWGKAENGRPARGEFWKRLEGDNDYCAVNVSTPTRNITQMDRYHQLNFSAWQEHRTIECRLLPMFRKASLAVSATHELISIYEDFLADPEAHGLIGPTEDVVLPIPVIAPVVLPTKDIEAALLEAFAPNILKEIDVKEHEPLAPGDIRTFRGTVLGGASLRNILQANNIEVEAA